MRTNTNLNLKHRLSSRKILLFLAFLGLIFSLGWLFSRYYFSPEKIAKREFSYLANDYYENYFYHQFVGTKTNQAESLLAPFSVRGLSPVYLHHLLTYDNAKHQSSRPKFQNHRLDCDTSKSYIIFKPKAPYQPKDYTIELNLYCKTL